MGARVLASEHVTSWAHPRKNSWYEKNGSAHHIWIWHIVVTGRRRTDANLRDPRVTQQPLKGYGAVT